MTSLNFLAVSFPMFPFDQPENIRKPLIFDFQGDQKGTLGRKKLIEIKKNDLEVLIKGKLSFNFNLTHKT